MYIQHISYMDYIGCCIGGGVPLTQGRGHCRGPRAAGAGAVQRSQRRGKGSDPMTGWQIQHSARMNPPGLSGGVIWFSPVVELEHISS